MKLWILVLCLLSLLSHGALCEDVDPVDEAFVKAFRQYDTVGGIVVVARHGEIVYSYDYGYANRTDKVTVSPDTYFRIASASKLVSGIHVMQLVEEGKLDLDEDISKYFGYTIRNSRYSKVPITLRMLMSHTSSISASGGYANKPSATVQELLSLKNRRTANYYDFKPGKKYKYSNFGAGLLGSLVEIATDTNLQDSIDAYLFDPLGIDGAYSPILLDDPSQIAWQYNSEGKLKASASFLLDTQWDIEVDPERHYRSVPGSLWLKGEDLCRLGILLCQDGELDGQQLLQPETVQAMRASQKGQPGITVDSPYGLCVYRTDTLLKDRYVYGHQGMSEGLVSGVFFEPESQFVVAVITNGSDSRQNNRLTLINRKMFALAWEHFGEPADLSWE